MSKLADALRKKNIFNTHNMLSRFGEPGKDVAVRFSPAMANSVLPTSSKIWSPSFNMKKDGAWYDYGAMAFVGKKRESFQKAIAWAELTYGVKMVLGPFGDYIPTEVLAKAKKFAKGYA